jgi:hypothetical protein
MFNTFILVQITYTSDYFQELYELAVELITRGCAYVDHQVGIQTIHVMNPKFFISAIKCFIGSTFMVD